MSKKVRKKSSSKKEPAAADTPGSVGFLADITKESQMSVIAVYGDALDKIGFEIARKANRNAEKRLNRTLNVYEDMATKNDAKYRKEKYELREKLSKLKTNQQNIWREYATRGDDDVGSTAAGILFRRTRQFERSGIPEQEALEAEELEAQMRIEAARKTCALDTRSKAEAGIVNNGSGSGSDSGLSTSGVNITASGAVSADDGLPSSSPDGATVTDKAMDYNNSVCDAVVTDDNDVPKDNNTIIIATQDKEEQICHNVDDNHENEAENNEVNIEEIHVDNLQESQNIDTESRQTQFVMTRMHTAPLIQTGGREKMSQGAIPKRRVKSTTTVPSIAQDTDEETPPTNDNLDVDNDKEEVKKDVRFELPSQDTTRTSEKLLISRKKAVISNLIQPAYFKSKIMETRIEIEPAMTLTPPQIRRISSPAAPLYNEVETTGISRCLPRMDSAKFRRISSPAGPVRRISKDESTERSPKLSIETNPNVRRISSPISPQLRNNSPDFRCLSPEALDYPETILETSALQSEVPCPPRRLREQFLLERNFCARKPIRKEKHCIVPDKGEMLAILEEQKKELQQRIDRFLDRQIRRSNGLLNTHA